jgi:large subunit ribosomal protein L4
MELEVYKKDGTKSGETVKLAPEIFEIKPNDHAIYQAVRSIQANQRQGTHKVKSRGEVSGGGKKPFKQKKTGRARAGTTRSGVWVGGGSIFGPKPHDYVLKMSAKLRALARKSALSYKAKDNQIIIVEDFNMEAPKTKDLAIVLKALSLNGKKTLFLTAKTEVAVYKSGRNIPTLNVREADKASTYDILDTQVLLIQKSAIDILQKSLSN